MQQKVSHKGNRSDADKKVLEAAISLFAEKGYAGTSVREIVERAGVTKPVLYYYFQNKEGIFRTILERAEEYQENILAQVLERPGSILDRLIFLYGRVYEAIMEHKELFKLIHNLIFGPTEAVPAYDLEGFHRRMVGAIETIYEEGQKKGEVKEAKPEEVAFLVQGLLDFCCHMDYLHPELSDPERPERLLRLAFKGLEKAS